MIRRIMAEGMPEEEWEWGWKMVAREGGLH